MGFLDDPSDRAMMLGIASGLLSSRMPSPYKVGFAPALGMGIERGIQAQGQMAQNRLLDTQAQIQQAQLPFALAQAAAMARYINQVAPNQQSAPSTPTYGGAPGGVAGSAPPAAPAYVGGSVPPDAASRVALLGRAQSILSDPLLSVNPEMMKAAQLQREEAFRGYPNGMEPGMYGAQMIPGVLGGTTAMETAKSLAGNLMGVDQNGNVVPLPGAVPSQAAFEGAKAAAMAGGQYPYEIGKINAQGQQTRQTQGSEIQEVKLPTGQTVYMRKADAAGMTGGAPLSSGANGALGTPGSVLDAVHMQESSGGKQLFGHGPSGRVEAIGPYQFTPDTIERLWKAGKKFNPMDPAEARDAADWLIQQNLRSTGGDMRKALAMYRSGSPTNETGLAYADKLLGMAAGTSGGRPAFGMTNQQQTDLEADKAAMTKAAEASGGIEAELQQQAEAALGVKRSLAEMRNLAQGFDPSSLASAKMTVGSVFQALGVPQETISGYLGNVGDMQAFQKQTAALAIQAVKQISPRATQMEFDRFLRANPNIMMTPEGMKRVIDFMDKAANSTLDRQQAFVEFKRANPSPREWGNFNAYYNQIERKKIESGTASSAPPELSDTRTASDPLAGAPEGAARSATGPNGEKIFLFSDENGKKFWGDERRNPVR